jgi:hypothetical protein
MTEFEAAFLHTTSVFAISGDQMITFTVCEQKLSSAVSSIKNFSCLLYQSLNMQVPLTGAEQLST